MLTKVLFFVVALYAVNASLITKNEDPEALNVFDPLESSAADRLMPPRCTNKICCMFCEMVGFYNGKCEGGMCKCNLKEGYSDETSACNTEQIVEEQGEDIYRENSVSNFDRMEWSSILDTIYAKCNKICDRVCTFLHFGGGSCATGHCKCSKRDSTTVDVVDNESETEKPYIEKVDNK